MAVNGGSSPTSSQSFFTSVHEQWGAFKGAPRDSNEKAVVWKVC